MARRLGQRGAPPAGGSGGEGESKAQSSLGGQNRELLEILGPRKPQGTLVLVLT